MTLFKALDADGDGLLTKEELIEGLDKFIWIFKIFLGYEKIMKVPNAHEEVEKIMKIVDLNNSGVIDYMGIYEFNFIK